MQYGLNIGKVTVAEMSSSERELAETMKSIHEGGGLQSFITRSVDFVPGEITLKAMELSPRWTNATEQLQRQRAPKCCN